MRSDAHPTCFPTGRHYPGIADLIAAAIRNVPGLCEEFEASQRWSSLPFAVIDFETTGVDSSVDRILEIGIVAFERGRVLFREGLLVNPGIPVPEESRAIHGITDEELAGAPPFAEVLPKVVELLQGRLPVAYNAQFDRGFLHAEIQRVQGALTEGAVPPAMRHDVVWLDPLVWAREILKDQKSRKLGDVAAHFNVPLEQAHRAAGDAEATGHVLMNLAPQMPAAYGEVVRLQGRYGAFQEADMNQWKKYRT
ncbi:MAG: DNA polymerase-3 subunit epsilon [Polyangiales bacterium]